MSLQRQAIRSTFWSASQAGSMQVVALLVLPVLTHLVPPEGFGVIALAMVYIAFTRVLVGQGFADALIQRLRYEKEHLDTAFTVNLGVGVALCGLSIVAAWPIGRLFDEPQLVPVIQWLSPTFVISGLVVVQQAMFRRDLRFRTIAIRQGITALAAAAVGIGMALSGFGVWSLVGMDLTSRSVFAAALWTTPNWRPRLGFSRRHFRELFAFGSSVVGHNFVNQVSLHGDKLLVGYLFETAILGFYAVAYRILSMIAMTVQRAVLPVALVSFSKVQLEPERARRGFYVATRLLATGCIPVFAGLAVLAPEGVVVVLGADWEPAIPLVRAMTLAGLPLAIYAVNDAVIRGFGRPFWRLCLSIAQAVINVTVVVVLARWGIFAVALGYSLSAYALAPVWFVLVRRVIGIQAGAYLKQFVPSAVAAGAAAGAVMAVRHASADLSSGLRLVLVAGLGVGIYGGLIALLDGELPRRVLRLLGKRVPPEGDAE